MRVYRILLASLVAVSTQWAPPLAAQEITLRAEVSSPGAVTVEQTKVLDRVEIRASTGLDRLPVQVDLVLSVRSEICEAQPGSCSGGERLAGAKACFDEIDNDGDGLMDTKDPDCSGVQGYTLVIGTDASFHIRPGESGATFSGTVSDDDTRPPGRFHDGLRYADVIDPAKNGGQEGVVSNCVFSFTTLVLLPPPGEWPLLRITGDLDVSGLRPEQVTAPCFIDIRGPEEVGLRSRGQPATTEVTAFPGVRHLPAIRDLEIIARIGDPPFQRGDANDDDAIEISDALTVLGYLFLGAQAPGCLDAADTDDSGFLEITDAVAILGYLFFGDDVPPPPGPTECGPDPTEDGIACGGYSSC